MPSAAILALATGLSQPLPAGAADPVVFTENLGQWSAEALYVAESAQSNYWVTRDGMAIDFAGKSDDRSRSGHVVRFRFPSATGQAVPDGGTMADGTHNYYRGGQSFRGVRRFANVATRNVAPGFSIRHYRDAGTPRYDLIVHPGVDPKIAQFKIEGAKNVRVENDDLVFDTSLGTVRQTNLFAYQRESGQVKPVKVGFRVAGDGTVGFELGAYDRGKTLVIDPQVTVRGSYFGGSQSDRIHSMDVLNGKYYVVAGYTSSGSADGFPTSAGAYKVALGGSADAFVAAYDVEAGTQGTPYPTYRLKWSTYIGGGGVEQNGTLPLNNGGIKVKRTPNGAIVVGFQTSSTDMPVNGSAGVTVTDAAFQSTATGTTRSYIGVLHEDAGSLYSGTYYATGGQNTLWGLDAGNNIAIAGNTTGTTLPAIGAFADSTRGGFSDGFVALLNYKLTTCSLSTYFGGGGLDTVRSVSYLANGGLLISGSTESSDLPGVASNSFDNTYDTGGTTPRDGFVARMGVDGRVLRSTYVGTEGGSEFVEGAKQAPSGNIVVWGQLQGSQYTTSSIVTPTNLMPANGADTTLSGASDAFVLTLGANLDRRIGGTFLGGSSAESAYDVAIYGNSKVAVTGYTASSDFPVTADGGTFGGGGADGFIARLNSSLTVLENARFVGGNGADYTTAISVNDAMTNSIVAGSTTSTNLTFGTGNTLHGANADQSGFVSEVGYYSDVRRVVVSTNSLAGGSAMWVSAFLNIPAYNPAGQLISVTSNNPAVLFPETASTLLPVGSFGFSTKVFTTAVVNPTPVQLSVTSSGTTHVVGINVVP